MADNKVAESAVQKYLIFNASLTEEERPIAMWLASVHHLQSIKLTVSTDALDAAIAESKKQING